MGTAFLLIPIILIACFHVLSHTLSNEGINLHMKGSTEPFVAGIGGQPHKVMTS